MSSLPRDCGGFQPVKGGGGYGGGGGGHGWGGVSGQFIGGVSSGPAGVVGGYEGVGGGHGGGVVDGDSGSGMVVGEVMVGTGGFDGSIAGHGPGNGFTNSGGGNFGNFAGTGPLYRGLVLGGGGGRFGGTGGSEYVGYGYSYGQQRIGDEKSRSRRDAARKDEEEKGLSDSSEETFEETQSSGRVLKRVQRGAPAGNGCRWV